MATNATIGNVTVSKNTVADPITYTEVPEVVEIGGLGFNAEEQEVTHFGSGGDKEFIAGLREGTDFSITVNYDPTAAVHVQLFTEAQQGDTIGFQIVFNDGTTNDTLTFDVALQTSEIQYSPSDPNRQVFGGRISGAITRVIT